MKTKFMKKKTKKATNWALKTFGDYLKEKG